MAIAEFEGEGAAGKGEEVLAQILPPQTGGQVHQCFARDGIWEDKYTYYPTGLNAGIFSGIFKGPSPIGCLVSDSFHH